MKQYRNLLPAYLQGQNIERHAEILETQDNLLYDNMLLLMTMFDLNRPILVEKVQEEPATCTVNVYVNTQYPIRKVKVTGDASLLREYDEEDRKLQERYTFTCTDTSPAVSPALTVLVETYDDKEYVKAYPENDETKGNKNDHDIFLDRIGTLLGIPRRVYTEQNLGQNVSEYLKLYPHFFTKQGYGKRVGEAYTEDDYYYHKRLIKFITERGTKPLSVLMSELLYEWTDVNYSNLLIRETSISDELQTLKGQPILQIINNEERYTNMDYSNMLEIVTGYAPITRPILLSEPTLTYPRVDSTNTRYINNSYVELSTWYQFEDHDTEEVEERELLNAPFNVYYHGETGEKLLGTYYSDDNGTVRVPINALPLKQGTIKIESVPEYEYYIKPECTRTLTVQPSGTVDMSINAWKSIPSLFPRLYKEAFFDNIVGALDVGRYNICHTPVIDLVLLDITEHEYELTAEFKYMGLSRIGLLQVTYNETLETGASLGKYINPYDILGVGDLSDTHIMECKIQNGIIYYYLDGENTEITQQLPINSGAGTILYLIGFNTGGKNDHFYIMNARLEEITTITDDCTTLNKWIVTDTGNSAYINSQTDIPCVRPPTTSYQRVYWEYPLMRGTNSSLKFKVYITTNANGIILGTMEKYGQDHMTNVKSWWGGLGSSNNWSDGPNNSQNRHGGVRMSYNTWHTIEFKLEDNLLHTYVDDVSVRDYTIPSDLSSNSYFNDYFFLGFSGNGVWIRDVEYTSNSAISDATLNSIRSVHMAQFE